MACCTLALGSRVGLELKAQGRALLQSSPGEWCRSSSCQPNLTVNPQTLGHGSAQGQDCTGSVQGGEASWEPHPEPLKGHKHPLSEAHQGTAQLSPRSCTNAGVTMDLSSFPSGLA